MRTLLQHPRTLVSLIIGALILLLATAPAGAAVSPPPDAQDAAADRAVSAQGSSDAAPTMVLLMDSSGSMREADGSGTPKIEAARSAVDTAVAALDPAEQVGLRVFGATVQGGVDDPAACTDSQLVVPIAADNREELSAAVDDYEPKGDTPIGFALQEAAGDLGDEGNRTIVLVSDGLATCDLDPCEVAEDLADQGIDLTIHAVGLDVDAQAREQLRCVAAAGRGVYFDADDAESLTAAMDRLSTRAYRPFTVQGEAVVGTAGAAGAPDLEFDSQYTDVLAGEGSVKHYAISRTQPGASVHAGVSALPGLGTMGQIRVGLETVDGTECGWAYAQTSTGSNTTGDVYALLSAEVIAYPTPGDDDDPCGQDPSLLLVVEMTDWKAELDGTPYEIVLAQEPPITSAESLPEVAEDPQWQQMTIGTPQTIDPGTSFNDAPMLEAGQTYGGELLSGETTFFRVPVEFGQRLQAQVDFPAPDSALSQQFADSLVSAKLGTFSPQRGDVAETFVDGTDLDDFVVMSQQDRTVLGVTSAEVRWLNRDIITGARSTASTSGDYFVSLSLSRDEDGDSYLVPFTLTVDTPGDEGAGAPSYADVGPNDQPEKATGDTASTTDASPTSSEANAGEPSEGDSEEGQAEAAPPATTSSPSGAPMWLWIGLAVVGVASMLVGGIGLARALSRSEQ